MDFLILSCHIMQQQAQPQQQPQSQLQPQLQPKNQLPQNWFLFVLQNSFTAKIT